MEASSNWKSPKIFMIETSFLTFEQIIASSELLREQLTLCELTSCGPEVGITAPWVNCSMIEQPLLKAEEK